MLPIFWDYFIISITCKVKSEGSIKRKLKFTNKINISTYIIIIANHSNIQTTAKIQANHKMYVYAIILSYSLMHLFKYLICTQSKITYWLLQWSNYKDPRIKYRILINLNYVGTCCYSWTFKPGIKLFCILDPRLFVTSFKVIEWQEKVWVQVEQRW